MRKLNESDFLPRHLSPDEVKNPQQVIHKLFELDNLPFVRELLWEFFKTAIMGNYVHKLNKRERYRMVVFYEKLQRLIEAVHIIHQNEKKQYS